MKCHFMAAAALVGIAAPALAQGEGFHVNMPAQPLAKSLYSLSEVTGLQVVFTEPAIASAAARPLSGTFTAEQMLQRLLSASGYSYTISGNVVKVHRAAKLSPARFQPVAYQAPASAGLPESPSLPGDTAAEIIVTATRQSQSAQSVPIALTAIGGDQLAREGVTSASQLGQVAPSLYVLSTVSEGSPRFTIRGVTGTDLFPAGSPVIATYIDDVYQSFQFGISSALFDLQRIEVLRGPQGTTFGKNTTGGAVSYFAQVPSNEPGGYLAGRISTEGRAESFIEGAVNVPIVDDTLAMRISGRANSKSNWAVDGPSGRGRGGGDGQAGRFQLRWTPSGLTTVNATVFGSRWRGDGLILIGQFVPGTVDPLVSAVNDYPLYDRFDDRGATLRIEQELGEFNLTSISHYRNTHSFKSEDSDGSTLDFLYYRTDIKATQLGQEVRLTSDDSKPLSGLLGAYYQRDRVRQKINEAALILDNYHNRFRSNTLTTTLAAFASTKIRLTDGLSLIAGIRKSIEKKSVDGDKLFFLSRNYPWTLANLDFDVPPVTPDQTLEYRKRLKATPWTWDATLNYNPSRSLLLFARAAKGFRSGGFDPAGFVSSPAQLPVSEPVAFRPETLQSYELGAKLRLLDNRLTLNGTVFRYDYDDQQVSDIANFLAITVNAGKSRVEGAEVELVAKPDEHWQLRGSVSYNDARFTRYPIPSIGADYSGNRLIQSTRWNGNGSVSYSLPVSGSHDLTALTTWSYRSRIFFDASNDPTLSDRSLIMGNIRVGLSPNGDRGFSIAAFVDNVTNKVRLTGGVALVPGFYYNTTYQPGRTFGLDARYQW